LNRFLWSVALNQKMRQLIGVLTLLIACLGIMGAGARELVLCSDADGHLAVEASHHNGTCSSQLLANELAYGARGDTCTDARLFAFEPPSQGERFKLRSPLLFSVVFLPSFLSAFGIIPGEDQPIAKSVVTSSASPVFQILSHVELRRTVVLTV
jgi:hypothetical protein